MQESSVGPRAPSVSSPSSPAGSGCGLAQASQSAAEIWLRDDTASRDISDGAIDNSGPVTRYDQPSHMVTTPQRSGIAPATSRAGKGWPLWAETLEGDLVGIARRALALLRRAYGPADQRQ